MPKNIEFSDSEGEEMEKQIPITKKKERPEEPIKEEITPPKTKPKRVMSEKAKEALRLGREKAQQNKQKRKEEKAQKQEKPKNSLSSTVPHDDIPPKPILQRSEAVEKPKMRIRFV
jgi:hypothetical protein